MAINRLLINNLRNLQNVDIKLSPKINVLYGNNGSGKTSILEAIYLLGRARSFRTQKQKNIITKDKKSFQIFCNTSSNHSHHEQKIGLEFVNNKIGIHLSGQPLKKSSDLTKYLPLLLITPDSKNLLFQGPSLRRKFLDWGVFHVERSFLECSVRYQKALKQRNSLLKQKVTEKQLYNFWDQELKEHALQIHLLREAYVNDFFERLIFYLNELMNTSPISMEYLAGWPLELEYSLMLAKTYNKDMKFGFTEKGPHRSDLLFKVDGQLVQEKFSGGQLKLFTCALYLAQCALLSKQSNHSNIILIDDLPAELDEEHRYTLLNSLYSLGTQIFVTTTNPEMLALEKFDDTKLFHVEHGDVREVV